MDIYMGERGAFLEKSTPLPHTPTPRENTGNRNNIVNIMLVGCGLGTTVWFLRVVEGADPYRLVWVMVMPIGRCFDAATCFSAGGETPPLQQGDEIIRRGAVSAPVFCGQSNKKAPLCKGSCRAHARLRDCLV